VHACQDELKGQPTAAGIGSVQHGMHKAAALAEDEGGRRQRLGGRDLTRGVNRERPEFEWRVELHGVSSVDWANLAASR